jgi:hypothetical protein
MIPVYTSSRRKCLEALSFLDLDRISKEETRALLVMSDVAFAQVIEKVASMSCVRYSPKAAHHNDKINRGETS